MLPTLCAKKKKIYHQKEHNIKGRTVFTTSKKIMLFGLLQMSDLFLKLEMQLRSRILVMFRLDQKNNGTKHRNLLKRDLKGEWAQPRHSPPPSLTFSSWLHGPPFPGSFRKPLTFGV